jgi:hypothetical protein
VEFLFALICIFVRLLGERRAQPAMANPSERSLLPRALPLEPLKRSVRANHADH